MVIFRRAFVWLAETAAAAVLIALWLRLSLGAADSPEPRFLVQWWRLVQLTLGVFMLGSGYLITSFVCAVTALREGSLWRYPMVVLVLFSMHLWFFSGGWVSQSVVPIYLAGVPTTAICAFVGNWAVRHIERNDLLTD